MKRGRDVVAATAAATPSRGAQATALHAGGNNKNNKNNNNNNNNKQPADIWGEVVEADKVSSVP